MLRLQLPHRGNAAIAFQYATVLGHQRRLMTPLVAHQRIEQGLKFRQLLQHLSDLLLTRPGRQFVRQIGAMQTRIVRIEP